MCKLAEAWETDKLGTGLIGCWLITVFSSFFGSCLLQIEVPGLGHLYLFRMILPVTAMLYILWVIKGRKPFWENVSMPEKWCWLLILCMLFYGALSLFWAIDFMFTFQRLFNLCFDLCFFFLMLRLCQNKKVFQYTLAVCGAAVLILCIMGIYEIFFGGIFNPEYDTFKRVFLFSHVYQYPMVTFGNTNDYAAALTFTCAIFLLFLGYHWSKLKPLHFRLLAVGFGLLYFLSVACSARLVIGTVYLLLIGLTVFLLIRDQKRLRISVDILLCIFCVQFASQYHYIVPPIQQYVDEIKEYHQQVNDPENSDQEQTVPSDKPQLVIGNPNKESLAETFYTVDEETGEKDISGRSNGMRILLILHAFRCFKESHFLGVGLGNTEMLAKEWEAVSNAQLINIHCFIARIIGDFGIFVLIPLVFIGFLLLKRVWQAVACGLKRKDKQLVSIGILFLFVLFAYPILSTISSDAQDILPMWIYLASIVLFAEQIRQDSATADEPQLEPTPVLSMKKG